MKALIAMSGGVDSSIAAKLMIDKGYQCTGCTMKLYHNEDACIAKGHTCCSLDDVEDARSVAALLGIPYHVFNFTDDFKSKIIDKFVQSYLHGLTPNPCIDCNRYMKFDKLYERAKLMGCDVIVTGHYARIEFDEKTGKYILKKAVDTSKDQSYVLYNMSQDQLAHTQFPLGHLCKSEVREIAEKCGFINADKPDSQDICFVPNGDYAAVIEHHTGEKCQPGIFLSPDGKTIGKHQGIIHYTIGQRRGLGLNYHEPLYVCKICPRNNTIILGKESDLLSRECRVEDFHWISGDVPEAPVPCKAKIRYRSAEKSACATVLGPTTVQIVFDEPVKAITPGQAAVLYDGDVVLGGGTIAAS
jgi:tRNA-specific 2-thiouridylase